jgi:hypothetical protein
MYNKAFVVVLLVLLLSACATTKSNVVDVTDESAYITAIYERDTTEILSLLRKGSVDTNKPDAEGTPPILIAIKVGIDLSTLETMLQMSSIPPSDILDFGNKNAYDYVKSYRSNNNSYIRLLDKYQDRKG